MNVNAGVIGCGNIARFHFAGLEKAGVTVRWACDISEKAAQPWADKFRARCTTDYRQVLADPETNAVFVTLISSLHKQVCLEAIEAGKAVVCEKTLATNPDDALEIVRSAEQKGTIFYTSYMKRFIPAVVKAKELMPAIGEVISTSIRTFQPWGPIWERLPEEGFFHTPPGGVSPVVKNYGGGILVCGGSHLLDLVVFFLGRPSKLYASMIQPGGYDYDLQAAGFLETPNGPIHFEALAHPLTRAGFLSDGWDEQLEITGTLGQLHVLSAKWDEVYFKASKLVYLDDQNGKVTEYCYDPISPFEAAVQFYCENISRGVQGSQSRVTGYEVDELIAHIKKSAALKQAVEVIYRI